MRRPHILMMYWEGRKVSLLKLPTPIGVLNLEKSIL